MGNTKAPRQELASIVSEHLWVNSVDSKGKPVCWIPLARITESDIWIGVTGTAFWAIGRRSAPVSSVEQGISIAWLTLLESSQRDLAEKPEYSAKRLGMTKGIKEILLSLPFSDAIYMALTGKSPHWAEIAISRLAAAEWKEYWSLDSSNLSSKLSILGIFPSKRDMRPRDYFGNSRLSRATDAPFVHGIQLQR